LNGFVVVSTASLPESDNCISQQSEYNDEDCCNSQKDEDR